MNSPSASLLLLCSLVSFMGTDLRGAEDRPNILWLVCEDASPTLGCYGDGYATTPNLDRLAAGGLRYTQAFATAGVCAVARSSLAMGMYASSVGTQHMRSIATLPESVRPFPFYLRHAGYYCSNNVKTDYNFPVPEGMWDESSKEAHWRKRRPGQPFFSMFSFGITHESRIRGDPSFIASLAPSRRHDPAKAVLPAFLPDTPAVRREWARYHDLLTVLDADNIANTMAELEADGLLDNTIVFFFSDHGVGLPRAKQFIFDSGTRVPLILHFPEKWRHLAPAAPRSVVTRLVEFVDFGPSVLSLAGVPIPSHMQGRAFLGRQAAEPREFVHGIRDRMDERIDMSRAVGDGRFRYYRNYMPHLPHYPWLDYMDRLETAKEFRRLAALGELPPGLAYFMGRRKAVEELYDTAGDPAELRNLAGEPQYKTHLERLRNAHFAWARRTVDTGLIPEQMLRDFAAGSSEYEYARSSDYPIDRCIATARLVEEGPAALPKLIAALDDEYPPVAYWAAVGLANLGEQSRPAVAALEKALQHRQAEVAIAAAEALSYAGNPKPALPVLAKYLRDERPLVCIAAANVIDRIGERARPMIDVIRTEAKAARGTGAERGFFLMVDWLLHHALAALDGKPEAPYGPQTAK